MPSATWLVSWIQNQFQATLLGIVEHDGTS